jgi:hypothetical protein
MRQETIFSLYGPDRLPSAIGAGGSDPSQQKMNLKSNYAHQMRDWQ